MLDTFPKSPEQLALGPEACPACEEPLVHEEGCVRCRGCGESSCG